MATFDDLVAQDSLQELRNITSPLLVNAFQLYIPNIPGGGNSKALSLRLTTCSNPVKLTVGVAKLHTKRFYYNFAGALSPTQEINCSFQESVNGTITQSLQNWQQQAVSYSSGYNFAKQNYATTAYLYLIGVDEKFCAEIVMRNFWLSKYEMADLEQDREKNDIVTVSSTFTFDYIDMPITFFKTE